MNNRANRTQTQGIGQSRVRSEPVKKKKKKKKKYIYKKACLIQGVQKPNSPWGSGILPNRAWRTALLFEENKTHGHGRKTMAANR